MVTTESWVTPGRAPASDDGGVTMTPLRTMKRFSPVLRDLTVGSDMMLVEASLQSLDLGQSTVEVHAGGLRGGRHGVGVVTTL